MQAQKSRRWSFICISATSTTIEFDISIQPPRLPKPALCDWRHYKFRTRHRTWKTSNWHCTVDKRLNSLNRDEPHNIELEKNRWGVKCWYNHSWSRRIVPKLHSFNHNTCKVWEDSYSIELRERPQSVEGILHVADTFTRCEKRSSTVLKSQGFLTISLPYIPSTVWFETLQVDNVTFGIWLKTTKNLPLY